MEESNIDVLTANRMYKSRIFAMLFSDRNELLKLYNAINGTSYDDPDLLQVNTLENAVYMSMQNDVSFIIDMRLNLYEHQSTYSPNLPVRYLLYVADVYSDYTKDMNLYGTKAVKLPTPRFVIFYNGQAEQPDRKELKLSELFSIPDADPSLELKAVMLNINKGHNRKLPDPPGLCGIYLPCKRIRSGNATGSCSRAGNHRMHQRRDTGRFSEKKPSGGEESEHI